MLEFCSKHPPLPLGAPRNPTARRREGAVQDEREEASEKWSTKRRRGIREVVKREKEASVGEVTCF